MSDPTGSLQAVKKRLATLVETAISGNPHFGHVSSNWEDLPRQLVQQLPLATIRLGTESTNDEFYGMVLQNTTKGKIMNIPFTIHLFASGCRDPTEEKYRYAHQLADAVTDYLEEQRFAQRSYGISDITDLTARPSKLEKAPIYIQRVIVEGMLEVVKEHTYSYS